MQDNVRIIYKKCGQTPLECINNLKIDEPRLIHEPMTYAGRLDPLAEGVLIILIGDECLKKDTYLAFSKEYEVDVLFGFQTDTYDVMGKVTKGEVTSREAESKVVVKIEKILPNFTGKIKQSYPPYSSRPVKGKPLFRWARENKLNEIEVPDHDVFVEKIEIIKEKEITGKILLKKIREDIEKVKGDFRQEEILETWRDELKDKEDEKYHVVKLRVVCGSGFYARVLAHELGQMIGLPSFALHILRTKVGEYTI